MKRKISSVLFIDDDIMSNMNSERIFRKANAAENFLIAESGLEGIAMLKAKLASAEPFPEFIFIDIYMPRLSGWDVLDLMKELPLKEHNTKIIMLTASPDDAVRKKALSFPHVSGFAVKPITEEYITELVQNISIAHH